MSGEVTQPKPRSDLGIRTISGVVMMLVAVTAIVLGGRYFAVLVLAVGVGVFWEWAKLVNGFTVTLGARALWNSFGFCYVGLACFTMIIFNMKFFVLAPTTIVISGVIGTDVGAYFAGRTFGGPKIAPKISPSKTWSGLFGGIVGAGLMMSTASYLTHIARGEGGNGWQLLPAATLTAGAFVAVTAQAGDFFQSWMKRKAGVKDSGSLIPGHGGLFDRTDGLIAVFFVTALLIGGEILLLRGWSGLVATVKFMLFVG